MYIYIYLSIYIYRERGDLGGVGSFNCFVSVVSLEKKEWVHI